MQRCRAQFLPEPCIHYNGIGAKWLRLGPRACLEALVCKDDGAVVMDVADDSPHGLVDCAGCLLPIPVLPSQPRQHTRTARPLGGAHAVQDLLLEHHLSHMTVSAHSPSSLSTLLTKLTCMTERIANPVKGCDRNYCDVHGARTVHGLLQRVPRGLEGCLLWRLCT